MTWFLLGAGVVAWTWLCISVGRAVERMFREAENSALRRRGSRGSRRVGLRLAVEYDPTGEGGSVALSLAMTDTQKCRFELAVPDKDKDGQPFVGPDGSPFTPAVEWLTTDPEIAGIALDEPGNNLLGNITSGKVGQAVVTLRVGPYPDATVLEETINVSIGNSAPGPLNLTLGTPVEEAE